MARFDKSTKIWLPGQSGNVINEWRRASVPEMIRLFREHAAEQLRLAQEVLDASDEDFHVEMFRAPYAWNNSEVLQKGKRK